jgi:hypothetical protein
MIDKFWKTVVNYQKASYYIVVRSEINAGYIFSYFLSFHAVLNWKHKNTKSVYYYEDEGLRVGCKI